MLKPNMCLRIILSLFLLKTVLATEKKASVSDKLLEYAETRANNAESELAKFKQQHEDSMAACAEIKAVKTKEVDLCKEQSEEFRKLYNQCQEKKSITERDLLEAQEAVKIEINKCKMNTKTVSVDMNTLDRLQAVVSDLFVLYKSSFQMIINCIPSHIKTRVSDTIYKLPNESDILWNKYARKEYPIVGETIDTVHENWNVYVYPNIIHVYDKSIAYGRALWDNLEDSLNNRYIDPFLVTMDRTVYDKLPKSFFGRIFLFFILIAVAYYTAKICIFYVLCSIVCCRRRRNSKKKKTFTAANTREKCLSPQKMNMKPSQAGRSDFDDDGIRRRK